jgi:1,4-dihydroxy-2-naphthoate octaprenyltransferase
VVSRAQAAPGWRVLQTLRPPFLLLVPACLSLSGSLAVFLGHRVAAVDLWLLLIGALAAHAAVNVLNELQDFASGLDYQTRRTPFSGGSGTLPEHPELAASARGLLAICLLFVVLTGAWFLWRRGPALLPLGLAGLGIILLYTRYLTGQPLLCLLAPGAGFGLLMVNGGFFALTGEFHWLVAWVSLMPLCLVSNLLLINQFPDREADAAVGRRHILVACGPRIGAAVFVGLQVLAWVPLLLGLLLGRLPAWTGLALAVLPLALCAARGALQHDREPAQLLPYMGLHVAATLLAPLLLSAGLLI